MVSSDIGSILLSMICEVDITMIYRKEIAYLQAVSFFYQKRKVKADSHLKKAQKHKNFHETKKTYAQT